MNDPERLDRLARHKSYVMVGWFDGERMPERMRKSSTIPRGYHIVPEFEHA